MTLRSADKSAGGGDRSTHGRELARRALAQGGDRCDADDRDQSDEQRVLDERGATFALDVGLDPGVQELVVRDHLEWTPFSACPARLRWPLSVLHYLLRRGTPGC